MIKNVFFDLDGTLLPMHMHDFVKEYLKLVCIKMAPYGFESEKLTKTLWAGIDVMQRGDGTLTNEEAFWRHYESVYGKDELKYKETFNEFYANEFDGARVACNESLISLPKQMTDEVHALGKSCILSTNPYFPLVAVKTRLSWVGLKESDFDFISTYENSSYCKPNPKYYVEILEKLGIKADESIMIGNDVKEDYLCAESVGIKTFLIDDFLLNDETADMSKIPHGKVSDAIQFIREMCS